MPWRNRYITTRRHPFAIAGYLIVFTLGVGFLTGILVSKAAPDTISAWLRYAWEIQLTLGGAIGLAALARYRDLEGALTMEVAGALISAFGLTTYSIAVVSASGFHTPSWAVLAILASAAAWRSGQCITDRKRVSILADAVSHMADARPDGGS